MRVVTVTGIRPDFIRMSEIFRKLDLSNDLEHVLVHTGQHYDKLLSDVFFEELELRSPDFNLECGGGNHIEQGCKRDLALYKLIKKEKWGKDTLFLFLGDSNSVLSSIFLRKEGYKVGHIESGQRSHDMRMAEECNRKCCDHMSHLAFCYHKDFIRNLKKEDFKGKSYDVGNTIVEPIKKWADLDYKGSKDFILVDIHRPENFLYPKRMKNILDFCRLCSNWYQKPVKMLEFGRTFKYIKQYGLSLDKIEVIPLMGYKKYLKAQQDAFLYIGDSGTSQEETPYLGTPTIVPRDYTERPQSVINKCSKHINVNSKDNIFFKDKKWLDCFLENFKDRDLSWLGNGATSSQIVNIIHESNYSK